MTTKIAILLSTYNGGRFLEEQIQSIIDQTNHSWELFIRDDGSTDETLSIIKKFQADSRIHWINAEQPQNLRVIRSFLTLLTTANAEYYMFCDQDDVWLPEKVQITLDKMVELEATHSNVPVLVHTDLRVVDQELQTLHDSMMKSQQLDPVPEFGRLVIQNSITGCTVMINQKLKVACQQLNYSKIRMHDWWFALVACAFGTIGYVSQPTILYRQHGDNEVGAKNPINEALSRKHLFQQTKATIVASIAQAGYFAEVYPQLTAKQLEVIRFLKNIDQFRKMQRYQLLKQYGISKSGRSRNAFFVYQILFW